MTKPCLYLISCSDSNRFKPCKVDPITRHTSTPGVSYGNLSQAHKQIFHVAPIPRCLCIPTNTRLRVGCISACTVPCPLREGVRPEGRTTLSIQKILQVTSVYRGP